MMMYSSKFLIVTAYAYLLYVLNHNSASPTTKRSGNTCSLGAVGAGCEKFGRECLSCWKEFLKTVSVTSITQEEMCKNVKEKTDLQSGTGINEDNKRSATDPRAAGGRQQLSHVLMNPMKNERETSLCPAESSAKCLKSDATRCITDFYYKQQRENCTAIGGTYIKEENFCDLSKNETVTATFGKVRAVDDAEKGLSVSGNVVSIPALSCLLIVLRLVNELGRLPGRNIVAMSLSMILAHALQAVSINVSAIPSLCRIAGVFLHWAYLAVFVWTTIVAIDLAASYVEIYGIDISEDEKFNRYRMVGFTLPTCLIIAYVVIDLSTGRSIGYGLDSYCFLANFWASISFAVFAVIALFVNVICIVVTSKAMKVGRKASIWILESERSSFEDAFFLTLRILQVWTFVGLGVILKVISKILESAPLLYFSEVLMSYQGLLLLIAVLFNRRVLTLIRASVAVKFQRRTSKVAPLPQFFDESLTK